MQRVPRTTVRLPPGGVPGWTACAHTPSQAVPPRWGATSRRSEASLSVLLTVDRAHGARAEPALSFRVQARRGGRRGNHTGAVQLAAVGAGGGAVTTRGGPTRGRRGGGGTSATSSAVRLVDVDVVGVTGAAAAGQVRSFSRLLHVAPGGLLMHSGASFPPAASSPPAWSRPRSSALTESNRPSHRRWSARARRPRRSAS